jgi:hypothetical protein
MSEMPRVGAFAIVPSNDLPSAIPFWEREWGLYESACADRTASSFAPVGRHG